MAAPSNPRLAPAVILIVLAAFMLFSTLISLPHQFQTMQQIDTSTAEGTGQMAGLVGGLISWTVASIIVMMGSICMLKYKGYSMAIAAAIAAIIPLCSPCFILGIPFGIWALVVLLRPEIKARF